QARLDSEHVQRVQAQRGQPMTRTRLPYRVPQRERVPRMTPQLVTELTGVPGARDEQRQPLRSAEPPDREPEPAKIGKGGLGRWRPHQFPQQLTRPWPLHREVMQVIGGVLDPHPVQAELPGDLAQPDAVMLVAADEAESIRGEPEDR